MANAEPLLPVEHEKQETNEAHGLLHGAGSVSVLINEAMGKGVFPDLQKFWKAVQEQEDDHLRQTSQAMASGKDVFESKKDWCRTVYNIMQNLFLGEMKKSKWALYSKKGDLIQSLQVAELLCTRCQEAKQLKDVLNEWVFVWEIAMLGKSKESKGRTDAVLSLLGVFAMMVLATFPFDQEDGLRQPVADRKDMKGTTALKLLRNHATGDTRIFGLDVSCTENITLFLNNSMNYAKATDDHCSKNAYQRDLLGSRMLMCYRDFLSSVVATLKEDIETARSVEAKILSGITTGAIALFQLVLHAISRTSAVS